LPNANQKGLHSKLLLDEDLPNLLVGDPIRLAQIVTNLLNNAIKFTLEGQVTITASFVNQCSETTNIKIEINDTGIGIPEEKLDYIFESFTPASSETTRKFGGTGLGLTI